MQKTKMIVTIGPSSNSKKTIGEFIKNGMNVARLSFYHHSYEEIERLTSYIRELDEELDSCTSILGDIRDSKIRTNSFNTEYVSIKEGDAFSFLCGSEIIGDSSRCSISSSYLHETLNIGDRILIDNGMLDFEVKEIMGREIKTVAKTSGTISKNKHLHISNFKPSPLITETMQKDIELCVKLGIDFISVPSVRKREDISLYKDILVNYNNKNTRLICKIENKDSIENIDEILLLCEGIIISRGDLGVEVPVEKIPFIQKNLIKRCNELNKVSIVSNQVLTSMSKFPRPTRAESSDVYNSVLDGCSGLILTLTTSTGDYPIETVKTLRKILLDSEKNFNYEKYSEEFSKKLMLDYDNLMSSSISEISNKFPTKAILIGTFDGKLPKNLSKYRPKAEIIAVTNSKKIGRSLNLSFGITPFIYKDLIDSETFMEEGRNIALNNSLAKKLDTILVITADDTFSFKSDSFKIITI